MSLYKLIKNLLFVFGWSSNPTYDEQAIAAEIASAFKPQDTYLNGMSQDEIDEMEREWKRDWRLSLKWEGEH